MNSLKQKPKILVITGPSFCGKTTISKKILRIRGFNKLVTTTMRHERPGETNGVDYWFRKPDDFFARIANDEFFEHEEVFPGKWYGSEYAELERVVGNGYIPVVTLDVEGAKKMLTEERVDAYIIYVQVPKEILLGRVEKIKESGERGAEMQSLDDRIARLDQEIAASEVFFYRVVNEDLDHAMSGVTYLIDSFFPTKTRKMVQIG